jgi:hypothetical protein
VKPALLLLIVAALIPVQAGQRFTGTVTDNMCPAGDHSKMRMGANDAECAIACINSHGAVYVLYDGKSAYTLSDQKTPQKFAGKKVTVTGKLDAKTMTIEMTSIAEAK